MPRILIVEDEKDYREQIRTILAWEGYEVLAAADGRTAIDIGVRFRPDVVVTDWMLRDQIHGLHVIGTLRLAHPGFRAILITAFPSEDLKAEAGARRVFQFIEKPFDLDHLQQVVRAAIAAPATEPHGTHLAVAEIDRAGRLLHANQAAKEMFAATPAGENASNLADLLLPDPAADLDAAVDEWLTVSPRGREEDAWEIRSQRPAGAKTWLLVFKPKSAPPRASQQLIDMLLGVREGKLARWPFDKRVLVIDDDQLQRQLVVAQLEGAGAGCYAAESFHEAIRLLEQDEGILFVVLDYDMPGVDTGRLATWLMNLRPSVIIVGNSSMDRQAEFARIGVPRFLFKPWSIAHLIAILGG